MLKKHPLLSALFLLLLIAGTVYILRRADNKKYLQLSGNVFGTVYHITYHSSQPLDKEVENTLKGVDSTFSMFNPNSLTSQINAGQQPVLNDAFIEVFQLALNVWRQTQGAFDITVAPLVDAWGFGRKQRTNDTLQTPPDIDNLLRHVGSDKIKLQGHRLIRMDSLVQLDFSAIAKGYACDALAAMMQRHHVDNYMIEIGGEVACRGYNAKHETWTIAVTKPEEAADVNSEAYQAILQLKDKAVATSGNYRNYYYKGGKRYAHTINPHTGRPVQHNLLSATVIAKHCALADAYATAFMVMGLTDTQRFLQQHKELDAMLIYEDASGNISTWSSDGFSDHVRK